MDHGFEAHVNLAATNDLGDIGGIIRLKNSNCNALFFEIALDLGDE